MSWLDCSLNEVEAKIRQNEYEDRNKNPPRKITAEVLRNVEDERIDDTIDGAN